MQEFVFASAALALIGSSPANAAQLFFDFDGIDPTQNASWSFDSNPNPGLHSDEFFSIFSVSVIGLDGIAARSVNFYTTSAWGGFNFNSTAFDALGPQLFTGSTAALTFSEGIFELYSDNGASRPLGTLTISSAVPEPATWAMMLIGFLAVGGTLRNARRKQNVEVSYA